MERYEAEKDGDTLTADLSDAIDGKVRLVVSLQRIGSQKTVVQITKHDSYQQARQELINTFGNGMTWYCINQ